MIKRFATGVLRVIPRIKINPQISVQFSKTTQFGFSTSGKGKSDPNQQVN